MKLRWTYDASSRHHRSTCGRYKVWLQARPPEGGSEWAAAVQTPDGSGAHNAGQCTWLTETAESATDAKRTCQAHADREAS